MTATLPETIAAEISKDLNALIRRTDVFHSYNEPEIVDLLDRARKLQKVDARTAFALQGSLAAICGDIEGVMTWFRKASLHPDHEATQLDYWTALGNVGLYSKAHEVGAWLLDPRRGYFPNLWPRAVMLGQVRLVRDRIIDAQRTFPELQSEDFSLVERAYQVMKENGATDAQLASTLDLMGEIQRKNRLMFYGDTVSGLRVVSPPEDAAYLYLSMPIDTDTVTIHSMNRDLARLVVDRLPNGVFPRGVVAAFKKADTSSVRAAA